MIFYKESKSNKKILAVARVGGLGVARIFFIIFFQKNPSLKKFFFCRGED